MNSDDFDGWTSFSDSSDDPAGVGVARPSLIHRRNLRRMTSETSDSVTPPPITSRPQVPSASFRRPGTRVEPGELSRAGAAGSSSSSSSNTTTLMNALDSRRRRTAPTGPGPIRFRPGGIATGPGGQGRNGGRGDAPIDLTADDSDDDTPVFTGATAARPSRVATRDGPAGTTVGPSGGRTGVGGGQPQRAGSAAGSRARAEIGQGEFERNMRDLNRALDRSRQGTEALIAADVQDERRRLILSPPPVPGNRHDPPTPPRGEGARPRIGAVRPRIGLGGAVFRAGNRQINFDGQNGGRRHVRIADVPRPERQVVQDGLPVPAGLVGGRQDHVGRRNVLGPPGVRGRRRQWHGLGEDLAFDGEDDDEDDGDYVPGQEENIYQYQRDLAAQIANPVDNRNLFVRLLDRVGVRRERNREELDAMRFLQHLGGRLGVGIGLGGGVGGAGPAGLAGREDDVDTILSKVQLFHYSPPPSATTVNFEFEAGDTQPISIDDNGKVIDTSSKTTAIKPYLCCSNCSEPLRLSSAYRSPEDRVWTLRCGHMIDQRCLDAVQTPKEQDPISGTNIESDDGLQEAAESAKPRKRQRTRRYASKRAQAQVKVPSAPTLEYDWRCPVAGCGHAHKSIKEEKGWVSKPEEGAVMVYM